jgi:hypothetical protein
MKKRSLPILCAILSATSVVQAAEPAQRAFQGRGLMLYISMPVNSGILRRPEPASFGLRLEHGSALALNQRVPLLDFRHTMGGSRSVLAAGVLMYDGSSSAGPMSWKDRPVLTTVVIGAAILGLACATNVICGGRHGDPYEPTGG